MSEVFVARLSTVNKPRVCDPVISDKSNLSDHLGNVRVSLDKDPSNGTARVIQEDEYYAFGLRKGISSSSGNRYLYNGKELQETLGQYDYGARFYDPVLGRWHVVDALADAPEQIDKTPYAYGWNNSVNLTDPDGNCPNCLTAFAGALIGGGVELAFTQSEILFIFSAINKTIIK